MRNKIFFIIQALLRYCPFKFAISLRRFSYRFFFKKFGRNITIYDSVVIKYPSDIELGDNVTINQFCFIAAKGGLKIGNDTMIGAGSKIVTTSHGFDDITTPMRLQPMSFKSITIEDDVWLGFNAIITGGSHIKKGSIVATSSVVTGKTFNEYAVIGGIPATLIRTRGN